MRAVARWACVADRASFRALWTLTDAFWAGESSMPRDTRLDPWGGLDVDAEGPLATRWPAATPRDELMGRPATGRIASRFVELTLRAALVTRRHRLPAAILPDVLRRAAFDLLHEAPLAEPDDWYRLARFAADMGDDQIEDYIAALAADGPLVATAASDRP